MSEKSNPEHTTGDCVGKQALVVCAGAFPCPFTRQTYLDCSWLCPTHLFCSSTSLRVSCLSCSRRCRCSFSCSYWAVFLSNSFSCSVILRLISPSFPDAFFYTPVRVKVNKKEWDYRRNRDKSWPTKGTEILIFSWIFTSMLPCSVMSGRLPYGTFLTYLLIWRYYTLFCSAYKTCVHNEYHTVCLFYSEHNYLQKMVCFPRYKATLYSTLLTTCWTVILINTYHEKVFLFY